MSDDIESRLLAALDETGYPLEMRVASVARQMRPSFLYVHQSREYVDPETGKVREADVLVCEAAFGLTGWTFHYAIVECKSTSNPWVLFTEAEPPEVLAEASAESRVTRLREMLHSEVGDVPPFVERVADPLFPGPTLFDPAVQAYGIATPLSRRDQNEAWNASRQALSAASGFLNDIDPDVTDPFALMVTPVVITSSRLFACWLNEEGTPSLREIPSAEVTVRRDLDNLLRVSVVQETEWPRWLERFKRTTQALGRPSLGREPPSAG